MKSKAKPKEPGVKFAPAYNGEFQCFLVMNQDRHGDQWVMAFPTREMAHDYMAELSAAQADELIVQCRITPLHSV